MRPFEPMGTPMNGYWQVPAGVIEDAEELESWAREAIEVASRTGAKSRRSGAKPKPKKKDRT
jgi:TfoX/Sxy family transcriptional regulator of competence genes